MDSEESVDGSKDESRDESEVSESVVVGFSEEERDKVEVEDVEGLELLDKGRSLELLCFRRRLRCDRDAETEDPDDDE